MSIYRPDSMNILLHLPKKNVKDGQTLKKYLKSNYNMTVDQATEKWEGESDRPDKDRVHLWAYS